MVSMVKEVEVLNHQQEASKVELKLLKIELVEKRKELCRLSRPMRTTPRLVLLGS